MRERSIIIDAGGVQAVHVRRVDHQLFQTFDIVLTATQRLRPGKSTTVASLTLNQRCFACSGSPHAAAPWSSLQTDVCAAAIWCFQRRRKGSGCAYIERSIAEIRVPARLVPSPQVLLQPRHATRAVNAWLGSLQGRPVVDDLATQRAQWPQDVDSGGELSSGVIQLESPAALVDLVHEDGQRGDRGVVQRPVDVAVYVCALCSQQRSTFRVRNSHIPS